MKTKEKREGILKVDSESIDCVLYAWLAGRDALSGMNASMAGEVVLDELIARYPYGFSVSSGYVPRVSRRLVSIQFGAGMTREKRRANRAIYG